MRALLFLAVPLFACVAELAHADTVIEWAQNKDGPKKTYAIDGVTVTISAEQNAQNESPRLDLVGKNGEALTVYGAERMLPDIPVTLRVTKLDPQHSDVDVMFGVYTGGAHCCIAIKVLSLVAGKWKIIDLGEWDGDGVPEPLEVGGETVLRFYDNAFLYAFTFYAASFAPLKLLRILDGRQIDVSSDPKLMGLHRENMAEARKLCAQHGNGGCAAYVASAARLGMFPEAWDFMLKNYDRHSDWTLQFCDVERADKCARTVSFATFPAALDWFLHRHGYLSKGQSGRSP